MYWFPNVSFHHSPDTARLVRAFDASVYFSERVLSKTQNNLDWTSGLIVAQVEEHIVWVLEWSLPPLRMRLCIEAVEVLIEYQWNGVWSRLIAEAERINKWKYGESYGYLSDAQNIASKKMFLAAWYTEFDPWKLYKSAL